MELIFLYGVPGVGKLTIAKEIANIVGDRYKIFHNQMTVDIISPIIPFGTPIGFELNGKWRRDMLKACLDLNINLITTFVYADEDREGDSGDRNYIEGLIDLIEKDGKGKIHFVHLICDLDLIFQRIQNQDRKQHRKVSDPAKLQSSLRRWELLKPIPGVQSLTIDTGKISAIQAAKQIISHLQL